MIISLIPQDTTSGSPIMREGTIDFPHGEARTTKSKLVNGNVHITDKGMTHKDRTANITLNLTSLADEQLLEYWYTNGTGLWFSDSLGVYKAKIYSLKFSFGVASIVLWITELTVSASDYIYPPAPVPEPVPVAMWYEIPPSDFDNYWIGSACRYDLAEEKWIADQSGAQIWWTLQITNAGGGITDTIKPTKCRITFAFSTSNVTFFQIWPDVDPAYFYRYPEEHPNITSEVEFDLNPLEDFIYAFRWQFGVAGWTGTISKVEIYGTLL